MITILPSDAMVLELHGFASRHYHAVDWWIAYQWFCERLKEWQPKDTRYEILNATSGIGCRSFATMWDVDAPRRRLAYLFKLVGRQHRHDTLFLEHLGLRSWEDLAKPIVILGRRPKVFPKRQWFEMQGRTFNASPNEYHPKATSVYGFSLQWSSYRRRWQAAICYGHPHDSSSWDVTLMQNYRESLDRFAARIDAWIDELLEPDTWDKHRLERERTWQRTHKAMDDLFHVDLVHGICEAEKEIADLLVGVGGSSLTEGRMRLNKARLATLKRWIKADKKRKTPCQEGERP